MKPPSPSAEPTATDFYRAKRGGDLFSERVGQRLGSRVAVFANQHHIAPTVLTVASLGIGCLVSVAVVALAVPVADGSVWAWPVGLLALIGWQIAYALDCADGQLARTTGQASPAGSQINVLCGVAAQVALIAALASVAEAQVPVIPAWLLAAFAGTWMVHLITSVMPAGPSIDSLIPGASLPVRVVKLVRDHGFVVFVSGLVLALAPQWTVWLVGVFTLINAAFLAAGIAVAGREALRR